MPKSTTPARLDTTRAAMMERVVVKNDLSELTAEQRLDYYERLCRSLGLNPLTRPFQYLTLSGRLTLYATKDCTEQLRMLHNISITRLDPHTDEDTYVVVAYGRDDKGREDVATGGVSILNLRGEALANAKMKAETKAKRRLTLSICGLGVLDETEVDDVSIGGRVEVDPTTGEIKTDLKHDALAATEPAQISSPPSAADIAKDELIEKIKTGFSLVKMPRAWQESTWAEFCTPLAMFLTAEAEMDDLKKLRDHLVAKYKEQQHPTTTPKS